MDNNYTNNLTQALIKQREKMVSRMSSLKTDKIDISKLQKELTNELKSTYSNNTNNSTENTKIEEIMKKKLMDIYGIKSQDLSTGGPSFSFSDLNKLIKIRNKINELLQNNSLDSGQMQQLETLFKTFSQIYSTKAKINTNFSDKDSLKDKIQKALSSASFREIEGTTLRGEFGETLVAYVGAKIQETAEKGLDNLDAYLEEHIIGSKTSKFQITTEQIPKDIGSKITNKQNSNKKESKNKQQYNIYNIRSSQDKIDVIISESNKSKEIKASVKTYQASKTSITPDLQDVSLLYNLLATEKDFHKHWLNLHYMSKASINENQLQQKKIGYDEELTKQILYEALVSGNLLKQQFSGQGSPKKANYMIAIDSNTGRVIIKSTYDLLNEAFNNKQNWNPFIIKPSIDSIKFSKLRKNHVSENDIYLHLIQKAQETKIKVSLKLMFS